MTANNSISIEKALLRLTAMLSTDGAHVSLAPYVGTIIWPGMTNPLMMTQGGQLAANYLSSVGYIASYYIDTTTMRTHVDFFEVGSPPEPGVPLGVRVDWNDAYATIPAMGQANGGVRDIGRAAAAAVEAKTGDDAAANGAATNGAAPKGDDAALAVRKAHARAVVAAA